jgi:hypothetical protein
MEKRKKTDPNLVFGVEWAVDIIVKRVARWKERKMILTGCVCTLIVPLIGPGVVLVCPFISAFAVPGISTSPLNLLSVTVLRQALPNVRTWFRAP